MDKDSQGTQIFVDRTLAEQVVRRLRKQIILGQLPPGQRLTEVQLAEQLGVSRGTVREALRRLEAEYLVESHSHRGSRVANLTISDAVEICELHALLEVHCISHLALPIDAVLRERLQDIVDQMAEIRFPDKANRFIDLDHEFHRAIAEASNLRTVLRVWTDVSSLLGVLVTLSVRYLTLDGPLIAARHQVVLDALSEACAERERAVAVATEHYESLATMLSTHGLVAVREERRAQ
jgi:DNA-binding GntR family transcriptional regulator